MQFCYNCNQPLPEGGRFCPVCGATNAPAAVGSTQIFGKKPETAQTPAVDVQTSMQNPAPAYNAPAQNQYNAPAYNAPAQNRYNAPAYNAPAQNRYNAPAYNAPAQNQYNAPAYNASAQNQYNAPAHNAPAQKPYGAPAWNPAGTSPAGGNLARSIAQMGSAKILFFVLAAIAFLTPFMINFPAFVSASVGSYRESLAEEVPALCVIMFLCSIGMLALMLAPLLRAKPYNKNFLLGVIIDSGVKLLLVILMGVIMKEDYGRFVSLSIGFWGGLLLCLGSLSVGILLSVKLAKLNPRRQSYY